MEKLAKILIIVLIFAFGSLAGFFFRQKIFSPDEQAAVPANPYTAFLDEVYGTIQDNYWQKLTDEELNRLFILGAEKLTGKAKKDKPENKAELLKLLEKDIKAYDEDEEEGIHDYPGRPGPVQFGTSRPEPSLYPKRRKIPQRQCPKQKYGS